METHALTAYRKGLTIEPIDTKDLPDYGRAELAAIEEETKEIIAAEQKLVAVRRGSAVLKVMYVSFANAGFWSFFKHQAVWLWLIPAGLMFGTVLALAFIDTPLDSSEFRRLLERAERVKDRKARWERLDRLTGKKALVAEVLKEIDQFNADLAGEDISKLSEVNQTLIARRRAQLMQEIQNLQRTFLGPSPEIDQPLLTEGTET